MLQPDKRETKLEAPSDSSAKPQSQALAGVAPQPTALTEPEQPPQPSRPETSRFQHVFAESAASQTSQVGAMLSFIVSEPVISSALDPV